MKAIKEIDVSITPSSGIGLFHDSRNDVRVLSKCLNICIEKINELVIANNELQQKLVSASTDNGVES